MSLCFDHSHKWRALALSGTAKTELAAKNALQSAWADWLRSANLKENTND